MVGVQASKKRFDADVEFKKCAHEEVVKLQARHSSSAGPDPAPRPRRLAADSVCALFACVALAVGGRGAARDARVAAGLEQALCALLCPTARGL